MSFIHRNIGYYYKINSFFGIKIIENNYYDIYKLILNNINFGRLIYFLISFVKQVLNIFVISLIMIIIYRQYRKDSFYWYKKVIASNGEEL